jgi:ketosteroid isomerase-like protein
MHNQVVYIAWTMPTHPATNLARARAFLKAIEDRDEAADGFYAPDVVQRELPNRFTPEGATRDLAALRAARERGRKAVTNERYEILNAVERGDEVALECRWSAQLNVAVGALAAGATMRAHLGMFLTFRDGLIISQRNYDCFEPF